MVAFNDRKTRWWPFLCGHRRRSLCGHNAQLTCPARSVSYEPRKAVMRAGSGAADREAHSPTPPEYAPIGLRVPCQDARDPRRQDLRPLLQILRVDEPQPKALGLVTRQVHWSARLPVDARCP